MRAEAPHLVDEKEEHLRARIHNVIRELYRLYTVISCREDMREKLSRQCRRTLALILVTVAVFSEIAFKPQLGWINTWGLVFAAGATGGLVSVQRRLQSLPNHGESLSDLVELSSGMTVRLSPVIGGTFAIVLFLLFCSGFVSTSVFPKFDSQQAIDFTSFATNVKPNSVAEWGKLLVWSFVAGFAERFVPDTLDRLIARNEQSNKRSN